MWADNYLEAISLWKEIVHLGSATNRIQPCQRVVQNLQNFWWEKYPHSLLEASGELVGLPSGQMGNSEVGHMNIGAGRIVYQPLQLINEKIKNKEFFKNVEFDKVFNHVLDNNSNLHLLGLLSDGGIHSHINHLLALIDNALNKGVKHIYLHMFLDGRDTLPDSAIKYLDILSEKLNDNVKLATLSGSYG